MNNIVKKEINISEIKQGDTVEHKGQLITVGKNDVKHNELFGYSFRGDTSKKTITLIKFKVPTANGFVLR